MGIPFKADPHRAPLFTEAAMRAAVVDKLGVLSGYHVTLPLTETQLDFSRYLPTSPYDLKYETPISKSTDPLQARF